MLLGSGIQLCPNLRAFVLCGTRCITCTFELLSQAHFASVAFAARLFALRISLLACADCKNQLVCFLSQICSQRGRSRFVHRHCSRVVRARTVELLLQRPELLALLVVHVTLEANGSFCF